MPPKSSGAAKKSGAQPRTVRGAGALPVPPGLPPLGAHMSIAGGMEKAVERALSAGCTALQVFLKNSNQWSAKPYEPETVAAYRAASAAAGFAAPVIAHNSYLVNLATAREDLLEKSLACALDDIRRADQLGVAGIVIHPGAHLGEGEAAGIARVAKALNRLFAEGGSASIYLETTAGQGTTLGHRFEHLRDILAGVKDRSRLGVCLDTCHVFAAGYDIRTAEGWKAAMEEFDRVIGLDSLRALHLNDSKKDLGSRVDRHEHIGKGKIGEEGFRAVMRDGRLAALPHILETPKGEDLEEDRENLAVLRRLAEE